jgi:hypothetical protein
MAHISRMSFAGKGTLLFLTATLLSMPARAQVTVRTGYVGSLNEGNIRSFLEDVEQIANGERPGMSADKMTAYFNDHVADDGQFSAVIHYKVPGQPTKDASKTVTKADYINGVVASQQSVQDYTSAIDIQSVDIARDGRSAQLKTDTREHFKITLPAQASAQPQQVPVDGDSICAETLALSASNAIQMQSAQCETTITLQNFPGKLPGDAPADSGDGKSEQNP